VPFGNNDAPAEFLLSQQVPSGASAVTIWQVTEYHALDKTGIQ
jgi:hypothetical protein